MKELGYGAGYKYAHDNQDGYAPQEYLPDALSGTLFYEPGEFGHEKRIAERMAWWDGLRRGTGGDGDSAD
jgi:putative ATPase